MENFKKQDKCLITGGAGFIGSHLTDLLILNDYEVDVVDNLSSGKIGNINKKANFICNVNSDRSTNNQLVYDLIITDKYKYIFHLAADASVPYSMNFPFESHKNNVDLSIQILSACAKIYDSKKLKKVVFASTSAIYGNAKNYPTNENEPINILSPYALQKFTTEQYFEHYRKHFHIPSTSLRLFNVYGQRQNGKGPYANIISSWINAFINNESLRIDGDGSQKRDFVFVKDVVNIMYRAALSSKVKGIYNVGTGTSVAVTEIIKIFKSLNAGFHSSPTRVGDPNMTQADNSLLLKDFDIDQKWFSDFDSSLRETIKVELRKNND